MGKPKLPPLEPRAIARYHAWRDELGITVVRRSNELRDQLKAKLPKGLQQALVDVFIIPELVKTGSAEYWYTDPWYIHGHYKSADELRRALSALKTAWESVVVTKIKIVNNDERRAVIVKCTVLPLPRRAKAK